MDEKNIFKRIFLSQRSPWIVASTLLILFTFLAYNFQTSLYREVSLVFDNETETIQNQLQDQVDQYINVLFDLRSYLAGSGFVQNNEWETYIGSTNLVGRNPGVVSLTFVERVLDADLSAFNESMKGGRAFPGNEHPDFVVRPAGNRPEYYVRKYISPSSYQQSGIGFDELSDARRSHTFTTARDRGLPIVSDKVTLANGDQGFLIVIPTYRGSVSNLSVTERRAQLTGFVMAEVSTLDFFAYTLPNEEIQNTGISIQVFDSAEPTASTLLYTSDEQAGQLTDKQLHKTTKFYVPGKQWTLQFSGTPTLLLPSPINFLIPASVFGIGVLLTILVYILLRLLITGQQRALQLAEQMTAELQKFRLAVDSAMNHIVITDPEGMIVYANAAVEKTTGYSKAEVIGNTPRLWGRQMHKEFYTMMWRTIKRDRRAFHGEVQNRRKNGDLYDASVTISPILGSKKELVGFVGIEEDISAKKQTLEDLKQRTEDLERLNNAMVGRELKMVELKQDIQTLKKRKRGKK